MDRRIIPVICILEKKNHQIQGNNNLKNNNKYVKNEQKHEGKKKTLQAAKKIN
jgi:hypothetical protein